MDRKSLRKKIVDVLKQANIPFVGQDIFGRRSIPNDIEKLPIILVYSPSSAIQEFDNSPKSYRKDHDIVLEIMSVEDDDEKLADQLDDVVMAVEAAIEGSLDLFQECENVQEKSIFTATESNGGNPVGSTKVQYTFTLIDVVRPEAELLDLNTIANNWKLNDNQNNNTKDQTEVNPEE